MYFITGLGKWSSEYIYLLTNIRYMSHTLSFREARKEDLIKVIQLEQDPANKSFIYPYDMDRHLQVLEREDEFNIIVERISDQKIIGYMILAFTEKESKSMEFRRLVVGDKGKGYGRQFIQWAKNFAFATKDMSRFWIEVYSENLRAYSLYEKTGFVHEGTKRNTSLEDGKWKSQHIMSILRPEYEKEKLLSNKLTNINGINLHHKFFKSFHQDGQGDVTPQTTFHYRQEGELIWATYSGGPIRIGTLSGVFRDGQLLFDYQHLNNEKEFKRGSCKSIVNFSENGLIKLTETWAWDNGQTGESKLIEIKNR